MLTEEMLDQYANMQMHEIRKIAQETYNIRVHSTMTKAMIIEAIKASAIQNDHAVPAILNPDAPKPGYARITLQRKAGTKNRPKIKSVNSYRCSVPRGVQVDIPYKVYLSMLDETETALEENLEEPVNSPNRWKWTKAPRENVTLHMYTPGPDPRPEHERVKERKIVPYRLFVEKFGYYPTDVELKQALVTGQIEFKDPRFLATEPSRY